MVKFPSVILSSVGKGLRLLKTSPNLKDITNGLGQKYQYQGYPSLVRGSKRNFHVSSAKNELVSLDLLDDKNPRILITGGLGQLGPGCANMFRQTFGKNNVFLSDIKMAPDHILRSGPYGFADVLDYQSLQGIVVTQRINWIIHFSALLSAASEKNLELSMKINMEVTHNVMNLARQYGCKVFIPSSIAAFGPESPRDPTPNLCVQRPKTIYGVAKVHTELLGEYFKLKQGLDFRSLRFPGVLSSDTLPGGGTTDYAVDIFHQALKTGKYTCYLGPKTKLPMMMVQDVILGIKQIMTTPVEKLSVSTYNIVACSFTPEELAAEIKKSIPNFQIEYKPDFRQEIADAWPMSFDDSLAKKDWNWSPQYDTLAKITKSMLDDLTKVYKK